MKFLSVLLFIFGIQFSIFSQNNSEIKPQIKVVVNDSIENFKSGIRASALRSVKLKVIPDKYVVTEFQITLLRGNKVLGNRVFYSNNMDLLHTLMAKPGDRLKIEAKHVMIQNADKTVTDVRFEKHMEEIPIK